MDRIVDFFSPRTFCAGFLGSRGGDKARYVALDTAIALLPSLFWGAYVYSPRVLITVILCIAVCVLADALWAFAFTGSIRNLYDFSSPIFGALLAFYLSPGSRPLHCILAALTCSLLFKGLLGRLADSPVHPVAATLSLFALLPFTSSEFTYFLPFSDAVGVTVPEMIASESTHTLRWYDAFFGNICAPLGCASALLVIAGGIYLCIRGVISIKLPFAYVAGVCIGMYLLSANANPFEDVLFIGVCGQSLFTAFFLCPCRTYAPRSDGMLIPYGLICGGVAALLCFHVSPAAAFPLSVVAGNIISRIIDLLPYRARPFGQV